MALRTPEMGSKLRLAPSILYVHKKQVETDLFRRLRAAHPTASVHQIDVNTAVLSDRYGLVDLQPRNHFREKKKKLALLHREAKWRPDPNGRSTDFLPGLMMSQGCGFGCTYCYTERHFQNNFPKLYGDVFGVVGMIREVMGNLPYWREKMLVATKRDFERHRDAKHGPFVTFDLGCDSDCVLDNQMTQHAEYEGHVVEIMNQIADIPEAMTSFATKSADVDPFISGCEHPERHRIRTSLMPEHHRKVLEINTSPIIERLQAVNKLVAAGFEAHINLSPIVVTKNFVEEYRSLLKLVDDTLSAEAKKQLAYEVIFLTHSEAQFDSVPGYAPKAHTMMVDGPCELVPKPNKPNVLSYSRKDKSWLKDAMRMFFAEFTPYARVRYMF